MNRQLVWSALQWPGIEHLDIRTDASGIVADGVVIAALPDGPVRLRYQIACDPDWGTRRLTLHRYGEPTRQLIRRAGDRWYDDSGTERPELSGCIDVDIALTPSTNTLPIRRLGLRSGQSAELRMVYVHFEPEQVIDVSAQRYTRLATGAVPRYRYQSDGFTAELPVDVDGVVTDYPELWRLRSGY